MSVLRRGRMVFSSVSSGAAGEVGGDIADGAMCTNKSQVFSQLKRELTKIDSRRGCGVAGLGKGSRLACRQVGQERGTGFRLYLPTKRLHQCDTSTSSSVNVIVDHCTVTFERRTTYNNQNNRASGFPAFKLKISLKSIPKSKDGSVLVTN